MQAYIGRQPIYDRNYIVSSYELLYRNSAEASAAVFADEDSATRKVVSDALNVFDFADLTEGKPAYINFTPELILTGFPYALRPEQFIIEIPASMPMDETATDKIAEIKRLGYRLSLRGYTEKTGSRLNKILHLFDYVRLNVREHNRLQLREMCTKIHRGSPAGLIMEQVETEEDFDKVKGMDFAFWQGYLFGRAETKTQHFRLSDSPSGRLFNECLRTELNTFKCCRMIENDPIQTHMFLGYTPLPNLPRNQLYSQVQTIAKPMGDEGMRKWSCLVLLKQGNITISDALPREAYLRGCLMEQLIRRIYTEIKPIQGFYVGVVSLLDQILPVSKEELISELRLDEEAKAALLGEEENEYSDFLQYVDAYEKTLEVPEDIPVRLKISDRQLYALYEECRKETDSAFESLNPFYKIHQGKNTR